MAEKASNPMGERVSSLETGQKFVIDEVKRTRTEVGKLRKTVWLGAGASAGASGMFALIRTNDVSTAVMDIIHNIVR